MMGALLADPAIANDGAGNDLIRRTLGGMLVGSIDTTATSVAKIMTVIGQDKTLAAGIAADVDNFSRLQGWCWEALRRWPHDPIVLRSAAIETQLAGVDIHVNDQIFIYTQAAMLDTSVFPDPQVLNPTRPTRRYLHFGGGLHPCAGRRHQRLSDSAARGRTGASRCQIRRNDQLGGTFPRPSSGHLQPDGNMTHAMVTFVAPLAIDKLAAAENAIDTLGNPASTAVRNALALQPNDENGTHFASLHAIKSQYGKRAYIVFEFSADGTDDAATARILVALGPMLKPVFMLSSDWSDGGDLGAFLKAHKVVTSNGLFGNPGVSFSGIPGFTVGRIDFEARLARFCATERRESRQGYAGARSHRASPSQRSPPTPI